MQAGAHSLPVPVPVVLPKKIFIGGRNYWARILSLFFSYSRGGLAPCAGRIGLRWKRLRLLRIGPRSLSGSPGAGFLFSALALLYSLGVVASCVHLPRFRYSFCYLVLLQGGHAKITDCPSVSVQSSVIKRRRGLTLSHCSRIRFARRSIGNSALISHKGSTTRANMCKSIPLNKGNDSFGHTRARMCAANDFARRLCGKRCTDRTAGACAIYILRLPAPVPVARSRPGDKGRVFPQ